VSTDRRGANASVAGSGDGAARGWDSFQYEDLTRIWRTRGRLMRNVALGFFALTLLVLVLLPSHYASSALVMLDPRKNTVTDLSAVLSDLPTDSASVQNQIQVLSSRDLAAQVVDKLDLMQDDEFNAPPTLIALNPIHWLFPSNETETDAEVRQFNNTVDNFLKKLTVGAVGMSTTIEVTFSSRDPAKSARIANALVDAYVEQQLNTKFDATHKTTEWLLQRIRILAQQVQSDEAAVQRYKAENNLNETAEGAPLVDQQMGGIDTQLVQARADLAAKLASYNRIKTLMQTGHAADVSQVVSSPLIISLREQQATAIQAESELETRYGARNPKLIAAQAQKRDLDAKIAQEVERLAGSVANDVAVARAQVASLEGSLRQTETESTDQNLARVKLKSLEANAVSTRSMYEAFVTRLREAQDQDSIQAPDVHVISHAPVPSLPSSPPKLLIALAAIPVSLLLGLLAGLLAERFAVPVVARERQRVQRPTVVPYRGIPVVAELPNALALRAADRVVDQPMGPFGVEMRALVQRIGASGYPPKIIAVTSVEPLEGKTTVALALARAAAQLGQRVVVVDGNLQAPAIAMMAGLGAPQAGLLETLRGAIPLSGALAHDTRSSAFILSPAQRFADPRRVWASPEMAGLLAHLRQYADLVIVDAGPLSTAAAPTIIALANAVLVVTRWNGTPSPGLTLALETLKLQNRSTGVVLTS
jgi:uncharacterized protein involved in exopolysaccharide biosynthesis/Mrp family chromosome partitioning ATPase